MSFSQFLSILRARWKSALFVLVLTVGTTIAISLLLPKNYTAEATVVIDVRSPDPIAGIVLGSMAMPSYMATQVDIIQSDLVARRVVRMLRMTENPEARAKWQEDTEGRGDYESWLADVIQKRLDVKPSREGNTISISYTNPDPRAAASIANAFVQAYLGVSVGLKASPAKQYTEFFDARAKELRESLEKAQAKLSNFQREHGLLATDERFDIETNRLNELNSQLVAMQAISAESNSRNAQAKGAGDQLQDVLANPVVASLKADASRQEARLKELSARLGDAHPQVQELSANIQELNARIEIESRRVAGSVNVNSNINRAREAEIRGSLEAQRAKVMKMREQRDEANVLLRETETAQRAYDMVVQRQNQTSLESQNNLTNISVLTPATEPAFASSPRVTLNTLVSIFGGSILALAFVFVRELLDRRIRSATDISAMLDLPLLGTLPKPARSLIGKGPDLVLPGQVVARLPRA